MDQPHAPFIDTRVADSGHQFIVLLVDDEEDILRSLQDYLQRALKNVTVHTARSGAEGLRVLGERKVDLIVTDYRMPGMDGLQFLAAAQKYASRTPRLMLTAYPDVQLAMRAINEQHVEKFLTKPIDPKQFAQTVQQLLDAGLAERLRRAALP